MNVRLCSVLLNATGCAGVLAAGLWLLYDTAKYGVGSGLFAGPAFWVVIGRYTVFSAGWLGLFVWAAGNFDRPGAEPGP